MGLTLRRVCLLPRACPCFAVPPVRPRQLRQPPQRPPCWRTWQRRASSRPWSWMRPPLQPPPQRSSNSKCSTGGPRHPSRSRTRSPLLPPWQSAPSLAPPRPKRCAPFSPPRWQPPAPPMRRSQLPQQQPPPPPCTPRRLPGPPTLPPSATPPSSRLWPRSPQPRPVAPRRAAARPLQSKTGMHFLAPQVKAPPVPR